MSKVNTNINIKKFRNIAFFKTSYLLQLLNCGQNSKTMAISKYNTPGERKFWADPFSHKTASIIKNYLMEDVFYECVITSPSHHQGL